MVRQLTPLAHKVSPLVLKTQRLRRDTYAPTTRFALTKDPKRRLQATGTGRFLRSRAQLPTIPEEDEDESGYGRALYRELDAVLGGDEDRLAHRRAGDDEDDAMDWDDESTLVALLQESTPEEDEEEQLVALANKLKGPMNAQGAALRKHFADTILPVVHRVKEVHEVLEDQVDLAFGTGLLKFDDVCKKVEEMALRDEDELKSAYMESQKKVTRLLAQLDDAYSRREGLWHALEAEVDKCAVDGKALLEALPAQLDEMMTQLDKKSKELDKENNAASKQKMLKGILEKLG